MIAKIYTQNGLYEINVHGKKIGITHHLPVIKSFYYLNFETRVYHARHDNFRFTKNIPFHYGVTKVLECLLETGNFSSIKESLIRLVVDSFE